MKKSDLCIEMSFSKVAILDLFRYREEEEMGKPSVFIYVRNGILFKTMI